MDFTVSGNSDSSSTPGYPTFTSSTSAPASIWLCYSAKSAHGKILAIIFPITAFVDAGFEHSIANMYFIPMGILVKEWADPELWNLIQSSPQQFESLNWSNFFVGNLLPVTIGNIIGGAIFVGLAYWFIYLRK
ncbi:hypothetical protein ES708_11110 [subsurface metagenome]